MKNATEKNEADRLLVLIVEKDVEEAEEIKSILERAGYAVAAADSGKDAVEYAMEGKPDLILMNYSMLKKENFQSLKFLKSGHETLNIPVIINSSQDNSKEIVRAFECGADDFVVKPTRNKAFMARVKANLRRTLRELSANPLTLIPGINFLHHQVKSRTQKGQTFAFAICDIDNFKAYNDKYGFEAGDRVIIFLAEILKRNVDQKANRNNVLVHIGGDDFVFLCDCDRAEPIARAVIGEFDGNIDRFYDEDARKRGYILSLNRRGRAEKFPIMTLSIGIVTNCYHSFTKAAEFAEAATEIKNYLKTLGYSNYLIDRRQEDIAR